MTDHSPQLPEAGAGQALWSQLPGESAVDYQLFAAWLQLPVPRPPRKAAAAALGCSRHRLARLFGKHRWKVRTVAFDNHRAAAASRALDELLRQDTQDWQQRAEQFRQQEWLLHEEMLETALDAVREFKRRPRPTSLATIGRLMMLATTLGRLASGLSLDPTEAPPNPLPLDTDWELALRKVYGKKPNILLTSPRNCI